MKWNSVDMRCNFFLFAGLAALVLVLLAPGICSGSHSFFVGPDARDQTFAWFQKLATSWQQGYLALWDANTFSGHSMAGEFQAGVFYPLTWLWLWLWSTPQGIATGALEAFVLLHFLIGAFGMAALLRHWRLGYLASAGGAIVFALIGAVAERAAAQPNIFFGLCWIPWVLLLASRHLESGRSLLAFATGGAIALQVLAGHVQPAFHAALIVAVMTIAHHWRHQATRRRALSCIARSGLPMLAALVVVAAPQWFVSIQYLRNAYRWVGGDAPIAPGQPVPYDIYAFRYIVRPADLASLIDPYRFAVDDANTLYVGIASLGLVGWFLARRRRRDAIPAWKENGPWLVAIIVIALIAAPGHYTLVATWLRQIPGVGAVRELGRYVILFQVAVAIMAAFAIQALQSAPRISGGGRRNAALLAVAATSIAAFALHAFSALSLQALLCVQLALAIALVHLAGASGRTSAATSVTALAATAALFTGLVVPAIGPRPTAAQAFAPLSILAGVEGSYGRERVLIDASAGLPENYAEAHRLQSVLGHDATMYRPYFDFLSRDWSVGGEVFDLLNVRYVLARRSLALPLAAVDRATGLRLYERPNAYPRMFLADEYRGNPSLRPGAFEVLHYDDQVQRFRITSARREQAIVAEIAYPGWCAMVNGRPARITKAVLGTIATPLRSVSVGAGENVVEFRYRPFYSKIFGCNRG